MERVSIVTQIGQEYLTTNIENGEYSYVKAAGTQKKLVKALGYTPKHYKLDIRFEHNDVVILVETKQDYTAKDEDQLREYLNEEQAVHNNIKIIAILANTNNDQIRVWKSAVDNEHLLTEETVLDTMAHYEGLFRECSRQNDREQVLRNTYALNDTLHKKDIDEKLRSQFVGTAILYLKAVIKQKGISQITENTRKDLKNYWSSINDEDIRNGIKSALTDLLEESTTKARTEVIMKLQKEHEAVSKEENGKKIKQIEKQIDELNKQKEEKINLLQSKVLDNQKVKRLTRQDWIDILDEILWKIYRFINTDSSEGQDILNLFFVAFNKYTGKADKNQAFTPDHITHFMCRVTGVDHTKRLFDGTCGSGAFLVQGMVLELADVNRQNLTEREKEAKRQIVTENNIYGIEIEEKVFGLATTNMLIHGDGNSNIRKADLFESEDFIKEANPDIILMNPPYNAKPRNIPKGYKKGWKKDSKEDPTKGMVFLKFLSDIIKKINKERTKGGESRKEVKIAILLPVAAAIGTCKHISEMKKKLLEDNTLEAVFTLPNEIFYPGASASACCMVFTLGRPHKNPDGTTNKTFFGYYKEDGHKKKKNLGRIEQFDKDNNSHWKAIEEKWLDLYRNKTVEDGISAMQEVTGEDEWLCEAYMKTNYNKLCETDFQQTINNFLAYLVKAGKYPSLIYKESTAPDLNLQAWKQFRVGNLLTMINGKGITQEEIADNEGDFIAVQSGEENNGVMGKIDINYCKQMSYSISEKPCLTVARSGSAGYVSFQQSGCVVGDSAKILLLPDDIASTEHYLFLQALLTANRFKYTYGRKVTEEKYLNDVIILPVQHNADGKPVIDESHKYSVEGYVPDWKFMEDYIKALPYGDRLEG